VPLASVQGYPTLGPCWQALGGFVVEENAPHSWIDKQVRVQVGTDVYNDQLIAVNYRG
jgi:hypothetical protein